MSATEDLLKQLKDLSPERDPRNAAVAARTLVISAMTHLYKHAGEELPYSDSFLEMAGGDCVRALTREYSLAASFEYVRVIGSNAVHGKRITKNGAKAAVEHALTILTAVLNKLQPGLPSLPVPHPMTEAETRKEYIDLFLMEAGWELVGYDNTPQACKAGTEIKVTGMPPSGQDGYCDYVLYGKDGTPLAVVEAKKTSANPEKGRQQVILYGERLVAQYGCEMPVLYFTNGYTIWCIDGIYPERELSAYHTLPELEKLMHMRQRAPITDLKVNTDIAGRPYQITAVTSLCEWFNAKHRRGLLVMATGTGKTRVAVSLVEVLTRNAWAEHVLFLADRTELVDQAFKAFKKLLPEYSFSVLSDKKNFGNPDTARVVFSTYQTIIHDIDTDEKSFGIGRFDLIITDEAHRSIFNKYGVIFSYFDSLLVGLTATPREEVDANTYTLFQCDVGVPNFEYTMQQGRKDGYLVKWTLKNYTTDVLRDGITYDSLSEQEKQDYENGFDEAGYESAPDKVANEKIFRAVYNTPTCDRALETLMQEGQKVESGELLGKTIIFACNHKHALMIVQRFKALYPGLGDDYCTLIDNQVDKSKSLIDTFRDKQDIRIAVSVDMLDTGVDVTDVLNLVFFKKVRSKIKFFQMLGRGTRIHPDLFGPGEDKDHFLCFDWCGNFDYFGQGKEGEDDSQIALNVTQRIFSTRAKLMLALQTTEHQAVPWRAAYRKSMLTVVHEQVKDLRSHLCRISVRKALPHIDKFRHPEDWLILTPEKIKELDKYVTPLIEALKFENELVKLFDCHMLQIELSLASTGSIAGAKTEVEKVRKIAQRLSTFSGSIPQVVEKKDELDKLASVGFWEAATLEDVEEMRQAVRALMVYLHTDHVGLVELHISDEAEEKPAETGILDIRTYREKVIDWLHDHILSPVVEKIRNLEPLSQRDMNELENILWNVLGTKDQYDAEKYNGTLPGFVRSLIGLDDAAVQKKFGEFLSGGTLNSDQQEFVMSIIDYLRENGEVTAQDLTSEEPFASTDIAGLFQDRMPQFQHLLGIINDIDQNKMVL